MPHFIGRDHVQVLLHQLGTGVLFDGLGFCSESNHEWPLGTGRDGREHVHGPLHGDIERVRGFLDLLLYGRGGPVVRDGGGRDEDVCAGHFPQHRGQHIRSALHVHAPNSHRCRQADRSSDQHNFSTGFAGRLRDGEAHLARASIADESHGIDPFPRRPCRDEYTVPMQRPLPEQKPGGAVRQFRGLEHPARAHFATGLVAFCGSEHLDSALLKCGDVCAGRGVRPHDAVHCRRHGDRGFGSQTQGSEQVVGLTRGQASQKPCARGRDQDQLRPARELDVSHRRLGGRVPQIGPHRPPGHGLKRQGGHELPCGRGHDHLNLRTPVAQPAHEVRALIGGYATGDAEKNPFALH